MGGNEDVRNQNCRVSNDVECVSSQSREWIMIANR